MRMIKAICDGCGYSETLNLNEEQIITNVDIHCIIASGKNEREERNLNIDLCKNCRKLLPKLYAELADNIEQQIFIWFNKENKHA